MSDNDSKNGNGGTPAPITPDPTRTPESTPPAAPAPEDRDVTMTQSKIDTLIKNAMGRAAHEVRQKLALTEAENERLRAALAANDPNASDLERANAALAGARLRIDDLTADVQRTALEGAIKDSATEHGFVSTKQCLALLDREGLTDDKGNPSVERISAAVKALADSSPNLIRSTTKTGVGSTPNTNTFDVTALKPEDYFGRGSSASAANKLALRDPRSYKALRGIAVRKGLI